MAAETHYGKPSGKTACGYGPGEGPVGDTATKRAKDVTCEDCREVLIEKGKL